MERLVGRADQIVVARRPAANNSIAQDVRDAALAEARAAGLAVDGDVPYEFFTRHLRGALVQAS